MAEVSRVVGIGAVKYADLRQNRLSDYQFDWDKMISFQGNAGPYLQYAYARCASIFAKGGLDMDAAADATIALDAPSELSLGKQLLRFSDVVYQAGAMSQPHLICEHIYELARAFNGFYAECPVLDAEGASRESRLGLTAAAFRVAENAVFDAIVQGAQHGIRRDEIHVRYPQGQNIFSVEIPLNAVAVPAVVDHIEVVLSCIEWNHSFV